MEQLKVDSVVELAPDVDEMQTPEGDVILKQMLGPGEVREIAPDGSVLVHWVSADFDMRVERADLDAADPEVRLIAIYRGNLHSEPALEKHKVVSDKGLTHNWVVEILPGNVIRTVRSDGWAWTFDWYPLIHRVEPRFAILEDALEDDDHAEALTVAELAVS